MKTIKIIVAICFGLLSFSAAGQCSITNEDTEVDFLLVAKSERIFRNEDLENGLKVVFANCVLAVNKENKDKVKFSIVVIFAKTKRQENLVPREISFNFSVDDQLTLQADEYDTPSLNGALAERCFFRLSVSDMEKIKSKSLESVTITDTRTNGSLTMHPFNRIFSEQIECLLKRYDDL